ncbi:bile acid:sodium symporter family protein [Phormidium tenue]|uniref:Bile acid:sodium symporter n=1 Tax=Phormidium tenue NIES-30 TaxID=549789 RepID=A0A1U7J5C2_9CYAN|nr:bile acid:sodium symporter family protein [Phormidium tenue]MBD2232686.1 bile acid:sodium symporter [Phormidium tenue FACHB-1052]OKH47810.1 bile acid:sodium symporter [Phormidium tenue NIES-30]
MESSFLTAVFLPLALFAVMLGMGLGLRIDDFTRVLVYPKAVVVGLLAQLVMLPILGFALASIFPLTPELAVGVMILAACPGGPTSNLITYLARGNVALSITLTAMSSLITVFTIPLVVNLAMGAFLGEATTLSLPVGATVIQIAVITLIPVAMGMALHHYRPGFAAQVERSVKWLSLGLLGLIIAGLLVQQRANVVGFFAQVGLVTLALNLAAMALGYVIAVAAKLDRPSATAITVEVGIQNGTLAIAIASAPTLLNQPDLAIPAAIYSLLMFATGGAFAGWATRQSSREQTPVG